MPNLQNIIAVVDDDQGMRESMQALLSAYGYEAETFDSAGAFLARASTCRAFCLIVDFHLGDITGVELAHQLAAEGFKFPIIFTTGHRNASIERQISDVGGISILYKPFSAKTLFDALTKSVEQHKSLNPPDP
jgi:FixJ family two-component response regulator